MCSSKLTASQEQVVALRTLPNQLQAAQQELAEIKARALAEEKRLQKRVEELVAELASVRDKANTLLAQRDARVMDVEGKLERAQADQKQMESKLQSVQQDKAKALADKSEVEGQLAAEGAAKQEMQKELQTLRDALERSSIQVFCCLSVYGLLDV